jgi:hypothetical protein
MKGLRFYFFERLNLHTFDIHHGIQTIELMKALTIEREGRELHVRHDDIMTL